MAPASAASATIAAMPDCPRWVETLGRGSDSAFVLEPAPCHPRLPGDLSRSLPDIKEAFILAASASVGPIATASFLPASILGASLAVSFAVSLGASDLLSILGA